MGDDFDLFPKRENLDPFAFGKKEKTPEQEKPEGGDDLFGQQEPEPATGELPDLPLDLPAQPASPPGESLPLPDLPLGGPEAPEPPAVSAPPAQPPLTPPPAVPDTPADSMDGILSEGPISEEKTFDEPVFEQEQAAQAPVEKSSRKSPSPFVVVGGALIIIIGLLYGALTYLKRDKPQAPAAVPQTAAVAVVPSEPEPVPVPEPDTAVTAVDTQAPPVSDTEQPVETESATPVTETSPAQETATVIDTPVAAPAPEPVPPPEPVQALPTGTVQYSVQVGAFILDSSVKELEKKLRGSGYDPILKKGSTTAMMNMLTVGPFGSAQEARGALSRLKDAGVDSNMRRRGDGSAVINAGSYLLEENATSVMGKVRSLGYPVKMSKREAKLPMTFVRVGSYASMEDANLLKGELKGKGLDGIVVKLQ